MKITDITVVVLAGGDSTRLWPLQDKATISFLSKPLIYHTLYQLKQNGYKKVIIIASKLNFDLLKSIRTDFPEIDINILLQTDLRGMGGAILTCESYIKQQPILVIGSSDVFEDILFADFSKMLKEQPQGIIAGITVNEYFPGGYLTVVGSDVKRIVEKPNKQSGNSSIVSLIFDYFSDGSRLLESVKNVKTNKDDLYETGIQTMLSKGYGIKFLPYKGYWGHLKYAWDILSLNSYYLGKIHRYINASTQISKTAVISGNVFIEEGVQVMEYAKIVGPTYIGKGTIIGNHTMIRESMIGSNCMVGFSSEITRSHIGDHCWFHKNYVGDSIIADNVSMGAGATLANFRLDEGSIRSMVNGEKIDTGKTKLGAVIGKNVRLGVNVSIMPGIKVGNSTFISSGLVLGLDVPDGKFCTADAVSYKIFNNHILHNSTSKDNSGESMRFEKLKLK